MYGITAVRFEASGAPRIHEVLMGLLAPEARGWDLPPAPVPLIEVIDRLLEGDAIVAVREDASGKLVHSGPAPASARQLARWLGREHCIP